MEAPQGAGSRKDRLLGFTVAVSTIPTVPGGTSPLKLQGNRHSVRQIRRPDDFARSSCPRLRALRRRPGLPEAIRRELPACSKNSGLVRQPFIHPALSRLQQNDRVSLTRDSRDRVWTLDRRKARVARLSSKAATHWPPSRIKKIEEVRVLGMVHRTQDDSGDPSTVTASRSSRGRFRSSSVRERQ